MVLVNNNIEEGWTVFLNSSGENLNLSEENRIKKAKYVAEENPPALLEYKQIAIYDTKNQNITVLLIDGLIPSPEVHPRFEDTSAGYRFRFEISKNLLSVLERATVAPTIAIHDCRI
jgi:hypothetical protein